MTVVEGRSEGKRRITAREAATLLGVHYNTVRNRIKDGTIPAEKVVTEHGPTWMIDPDSLTTNAPTSADQQLVGRVPPLPEETLTFLAREIVREAGIAQDQARAGLLENDKAHAEFFKTVLLLDTALLAGAAAVGSVVQDPRSLGLLMWAFALVIISLASGFFGLYSATGVIGGDENMMSNFPKVRARAVRDFTQVATVVNLVTAIALFIQFVFLNLPSDLD